MPNQTYLANRKQYARPQAIVWLENATPLSSSAMIITGTEYTNFLILSDHNRSELSFTAQRIENRKRMINGGMRSYHIADKLNISWSWDFLPSRSFSKDPQFNSSGSAMAIDYVDYTADGGAGGREILKWYQDHPGAFYMLLAYDTYNGVTGQDQYSQLGQYNQLLQVYFSGFDYNVQKRGGTNHDLWNVSVQLEEA